MYDTWFTKPISCLGVRGQNLSFRVQGSGIGSKEYGSPPTPGSRLTPPGGLKRQICVSPQPRETTLSLSTSVPSCFA